MNTAPATSTLKSGDACFLLTNQESLMPGTYIGPVMLGGREFAEVASPGGRRYTCNLSNLFDREVGELMLMQQRAEGLLRAGYRVAVRNDGSFRIYCAKKHGARGGYIVREWSEGSWCCNCPAHAKAGSCKHVMGVCALLWNRAHQAGAQGWQAGRSRYERLALHIATC